MAALSLSRRQLPRLVAAMRVVPIRHRPASAVGLGRLAMLCLAGWAELALALPVPIDDNPGAPTPVLAIPLMQDASLSVGQNDTVEAVRPRPAPAEPAALRTSVPRAGAASAAAPSDPLLAGPKRANVERQGDGATPTRQADRPGFREDDPESSASEQTTRHVLVLHFNPLDAILAPLDEDDQEELRHTARAALTTAKDSLTWLRPTFLGSGSALNLDDMPAGFGPQRGADTLGIHVFSRTVSSLEGGAKPGSSAAGSEYSGPREGGAARSSRDAVDASELDSLREIIRTLRTVLDHPMSWFVLSLVAIAMTAVSTARRWLR